MARTPTAELNYLPTVPTPFRRGRAPICASADCRSPFKPERRNQRFCGDKCRNRENQRRLRNRGAIEQHITVLRRTLTELAALVSPTEGT